jgi:hypothetical protein
LSFCWGERNCSLGNAPVIVALNRDRVPAPGVAGVVGGGEAGRFGHVRSLGEAGGQCGGVVGIAGESNGLAAFLPPPGEEQGGRGTLVLTSRIFPVLAKVRST